MEPKFVIQGVDYPVAAWDDFDMGEAEILTAKTGLTLIDLSQGDVPLTPGLLSTMMIVAYMRGNPAASRTHAENIVSKVKLLEAIEHLGGGEDSDAVPPSQQPMPHGQPDAPESIGSSPTTSGDDLSPPSGSLPEPDPLPTGTLASVMQRTSAQKQLAG